MSIVLLSIASLLPVSYRFSELKKSGTLQVSEGSLKLVKTIDATNYAQYALVEPQLSDTLPSQISFKINRVTNRVTLGVGDLSFLEVNGYQCAGDLLHGHFANCQNGLILSHNIQVDNRKPVGVKFRDGDTVMVTFEPASGKLVYSCGDQRYEHFIGTQPRRLHFEVGLHNKNDSVSIEL